MRFNPPLEGEGRAPKVRGVGWATVRRGGTVAFTPSRSLALATSPLQGEVKKCTRSPTMPTRRRKPPNDHDFNKRSTAAQRAALADAAQIATARIYADVAWFWRQ